MKHVLTVVIAVLTLGATRCGAGVEVPPVSAKEAAWHARYDEIDAACGVRFSTACEGESCAAAIAYPNNLVSFVWAHPRRFAMSALMGLHPRTERCQRTAQLSPRHHGTLTVESSGGGTIVCQWIAPDRTVAQSLCATAARPFGGEQEVAAAPDVQLRWELERVEIKALDRRPASAAPPMR